MSAQHGHEKCPPACSWEQHRVHHSIPVHLQVTCDARVYRPGGIHKAAPQPQVLNKPLQKNSTALL